MTRVGDASETGGFGDDGSDSAAEPGHHYPAVWSLCRTAQTCGSQCSIGQRIFIVATVMTDARAGPFPRRAPPR